MSTLASLQELEVFLKKYRKRIKLPFANYGGGFIEGEEVIGILIKLNILDPIADKYKYQVSGKSTDNEGRLRDLLTSMGVLRGYEILDYSTGIDLMKPIKGKYKTGICMDLLEHTANPFMVADNISNSLSEGSLLFVTVPWIWGIHEYPVDNWRFTATGLATLFPKMRVLESRYVKDLFDSIKNLPNERVVAVFEKVK